MGGGQQNWNHAVISYLRRLVCIWKCQDIIHWEQRPKKTEVHSRLSSQWNLFLCHPLTFCLYASKVDATLGSSQDVPASRGHFLVEPGVGEGATLWKDIVLPSVMGRPWTQPMPTPCYNSHEWKGFGGRWGESPKSWEDPRDYPQRRKWKWWGTPKAEGIRAKRTLLWYLGLTDRGLCCCMQSASVLKHNVITEMWCAWAQRIRRFLPLKG